MSIKKGIILAAGLATRLHPATLAFGKPFLPVYDKPMIYYPLSLLIAAGIREIMLITSPRDRKLFEMLLGDGSDFGVKLCYAEQPVAKGIADAFLVGEEFIGGDSCCLILGDNFFDGPDLHALLAKASAAHISGASIFCAHVEDPRAFGVAEIEANGSVKALAEKPKEPLSNWAVTGIYFYDGKAAHFAKKLTPSARGELEITDLNILYLKENALKAVTFGKDVTWFDLGTHSAILEAGLMVRAREEKENRKIGCPFETAWRQGFIDKAQLAATAGKIRNPAYAARLKGLADED